MRSDDEGMVTAELAVCLPILVLLLAVALGAVSVAGARVRVADVARDAARLAARSDDAGLSQLRSRASPIGIVVSAEGSEVVAVATGKADLVGGLAPVTVTATSVASVEPVS